MLEKYQSNPAETEALYIFLATELRKLLTHSQPVGSETVAVVIALNATVRTQMRDGHPVIEKGVGTATVR